MSPNLFFFLGVSNQTVKKTNKKNTENISFVVTQRIKLENFKSEIDYKKI